MAKILVKNSVTSGSSPAGLSLGEIAVNITDRKIFFGNAVESAVAVYDRNAHVLSFNGLTGAVTFNNYVASINGLTGAITNVARTNEGNSFSVRQVMDGGITSANLYVTNGATFSTIEATSTTNTIDVVASTDGAGLRIAQATTGSSARVGGIRLGRSTSTGSNVYLEGYVGTFRVYNGISGTVAPTGTKMLELSTSGGAIFDIPIAGATFSSSAGRITVQKSSYIGSDSGTVRIVGADVSASTYNSDIRANADAAADTTHTLPAVSGTLLNTASSYVSSLNGATGAITNVARTNEGNTFSVRQVMNSGITTANLFVSTGATFASTTSTTGLATFSGGVTASNFYVSGGSTFASSINLLGALLISGNTGTNNQVLTSTGSGITWATASGGGLSWSAVTADQSLTVDTGVLANKSSGTLTLTLPTTAAVGKTIRVSGMQNTWKIAQNASQIIHFGKTDTTTGTGGYLQSTNARDAVELVCCVANNEWNVISSVGNITIV